MRRQKRDFIGIVLLAMGLWTFSGCPRPVAVSPQLPQAPVPRTASDAPVAALPGPADLVTTYDLDRDGKVELWVHRAPGPDGGVGRTVRKELDMNGDGQPDLLKEYGADGLLSRESYDTNFDGRSDAVSTYSGGLLRESLRDEDSDGRLETRVFFLDEVISRIEGDLDGDGRVDYREEWAGGTLTSRWADRDGDGVLSEITASGLLDFPDAGF